MEQMQPRLAWLESRLNMMRALPSDTFLMVIAGAVLVILLLLSVWMTAARRVQASRRVLAALEVELASSRRALEEEIKWRQSAERRGAQVPKPPP
jgi:hypothetical protein